MYRIKLVHENSYQPHWQGVFIVLVRHGPTYNNSITCKAFTNNNISKMIFIQFYELTHLFKLSGAYLCLIQSIQIILFHIYSHQPKVDSIRMNRCSPPKDDHLLVKNPKISIMFQVFLKLFLEVSTSKSFGIAAHHM